MPERETLSNLEGLYPYAERYGTNAVFPSKGRSSEEILAELRELADQEDSFWQTGKCSGTMYCGDREHYALLNEAFGLFSHMNALQRDMCPSATRFEGEIVAMTLDLMHADEARPEASPCGAVTSGGTESIVSAILAYRNRVRARGIAVPQIIKPETAHPAFDKACDLLGLEVIEAPVDPETTLVDLDYVADHITERTAVLVGSAGNYPYGTVDPIEALSHLALDHGIGLHVDACLGGFILPWREELGYDTPRFDFRIPGVTSISVDTHKFGYGLKGTSLVLFRNRELRQYLYFMRLDWSGGTYASPGLAGSRSVGVLAAAWASLVRLGREGFRRHAREIFETSFAMQRTVQNHPELRLMGKPTFCFSFTSDRFDIYHLNDFMRTRGWRFNGQQHPNAIHMCVTRPQTRSDLVEVFARDLADAVAYAKNPSRSATLSGAIYGGAPDDAPDPEENLRERMIRYLDASQDVP
jgi:glutamate/tyrosine decarboxylase-like PLP-dependent enzyme